MAGVPDGRTLRAGTPPAPTVHVSAVVSVVPPEPVEETLRPGTWASAAGSAPRYSLALTAPRLREPSRCLNVADWGDSLQVNASCAVQIAQVIAGCAVQNASALSERNAIRAQKTMPHPGLGRYESLMIQRISCEDR
jgi:hypothetical protein